MTVLDGLVFGGVGSLALVLFYKAFFQRPPREHTEGGENDPREADDGSPSELGLDRD